MRRFHLALPRSIDDCLKLLAERGSEAKLVAGGTDLLPQMKNGLLKPAAVVDLSGVRRTVLAPDELLVEFVIPAPGPRSGGAYLRHTPRRELDIAVVGVASQVTLTDGVCARARIALAAVAAAANADASILPSRP